MTRPQILFLDAYDSFTNNIVSLLTTLLDADVHVLPIDSPLISQSSPDFSEVFRRELAHYHAVVCGPGPGSPHVERDVGLMRCVWELEQENLLPVLGICLGFQSLVLSSGGKIRRLQRGLHGMVRDVQHDKPEELAPKGDLFRGVAPFKATLYHSLCADIGQDEVPVGEWENRRWNEQASAPNLLPLAWASEERENGIERILMAVKHREYPFWGLQYHPESICTEFAGHAVLQNWFAESMRWNKMTNRRLRTGESLLARNATKPSLLSEVRIRQGQEDGQPRRESPWSFATVGLDCDYNRQSIPLSKNVKVPDIVESLRSTSSEHIILDSANAETLAWGAADVRGRYSIIALDVQEAFRIEYHVGDDFATARIPNAQGMTLDHEDAIPLHHHGGIWQLLADFMEKRHLSPRDDVETPFVGGFMGYVTYELGLDGINVKLPSDRGHRRPDLCFVWVSKSLVVDHTRGLLHVQHLQKKKLQSEFWIDSTIKSLTSSAIWKHGEVLTQSGPIFSAKPIIKTPKADDYELKVKTCQDFIAAGESYELCLTDQTTITVRNKVSDPSLANGTNGTSNQTNEDVSTSKGQAHDAAWNLYRTLRARQPAPFGSFIRLGGATLVSSSPERFLQYSAGGVCSMRPMKGTVRKSTAVSTLAQAEEILHVPKEEAENLMIVDLVRHDLHGVCGAGNVTVPRLMKVEEYASVFQMITVVDAKLPSPTKKAEDARNGVAEKRAEYTGLDVLAASLPPGSMTGAPKKRSCDLLREIEEFKERSLYSGVVGYMDVTGKGDWSVTIRTMFRWDDETTPPEAGETEGTETWHIGAGGAVTILSTPEGERDEMFTKLAGPLGIFS